LRREDLVKLSIERIAARGDGIAHHNGEPVFLPFTAPGDVVLAQLAARRRGDVKAAWSRGGLLAEYAEDCNLARIVWRSCVREIPIVERCPVRVLISGISVAFPPGTFLQASAAAESILVEEVLSGTGDRRPALDLFAGLGTFASSP
jgi:tRNA/tmRNA/rRNA uracil-C5-methylase (TrmA/RlmC/RlmD family)